MATAAKIRVSAEVFEIVLDSTAILNKSVPLPMAPYNDLKVAIDVIGGTSQSQFVDYIISGSTLSWAAMGMETILSVNDKIRVVFYK